MKIKILPVFYTLVVIIGLSSCHSTKTTSHNTPLTATIHIDFTSKDQSWKSLSLREKIGQTMIIRAFHDDQVKQYGSIQNMLDQYPVGGIYVPWWDFLYKQPRDSVIYKVKKAVAAAGSVQLVVGTDATREEAALLKEKSAAAFGKPMTVNYHSGFVATSKDDKKLDHLLRMADKTPNTRGVEDEGLAALPNGEVNAEIAILFRNGRAGIPIMSSSQKVILWGVWNFDEIKALPTKNIIGVIPGLSTIEKEGSFKNADGIVQKFHAAIIHRGGAMSAHHVVGVMNSNK